jgi:hypothetical protein
MTHQFYHSKWRSAACYAHASQSPDYYYEVQDTVANFRGLQSGAKKAEAYILQLQPR